MPRPADHPDALEARYGLALSEAQRALLAAYRAAVLDATQRVNLTAAASATPERLRETLEVPSYAVAAGWGTRPTPAQVMDVGSGNGFPGVVAAVLWPAARVLLVERRGKKAAAVAACLEAAGIRNAEVLAEDARDAAAHRPELRGAVDLVTARGVGPLAVVNRLAAPFLAPGGLVMHWKATDIPQDELAEGDRSAVRRGWAARRELAFTPVPPGPGRLVIYELPGPRSA